MDYVPSMISPGKGGHISKIAQAVGKLIDVAPVIEIVPPIVLISKDWVVRVTTYPGYYYAYWNPDTNDVVRIDGVVQLLNGSIQSSGGNNYFVWILPQYDQLWINYAGFLSSYSGFQPTEFYPVSSIPESQAPQYF